MVEKLHSIMQPLSIQHFSKAITLKLHSVDDVSGELILIIIEFSA